MTLVNPIINPTSVKLRNFSDIEECNLRDFQIKLFNEYFKNNDQFKITLSAPRQYGTTTALALLALNHVAKYNVIFASLNPQHVTKILKQLQFDNNFNWNEQIIVCDYRDFGRKTYGLTIDVMNNTLIILDNYDLYLKEHEPLSRLDFFSKQVVSKLASTYSHKDSNVTFITATKDEYICNPDIRRMLNYEQYKIEHGNEELLTVRDWFVNERNNIYQWFKSTYNKGLSYGEIIDKIDEYKVNNCKSKELVSFRELVDAIILDIFGVDGEYRTSDIWLNYYQEKISDILIIDPDGWDRSNYEFSFYKERISFREFEERVSISTILRNYDKTNNFLNNSKLLYAYVGNMKDNNYTLNGLAGLSFNYDFPYTLNFERIINSVELQDDLIESLVKDFKIFLDKSFKK